MGNTQEAQSTVNETLITSTNLIAALKKAKGSEAQLVSWTVKKFTPINNKFVSDMTRVKVQYVIDGIESMISFIAKLGPPQPTNVLYDSNNFAFMKEARVYLELLPALSSELTSIGLEPLRLPECFYATWDSEKEVIYLQDLRLKGFKSYDPKKGLDFAHTTLVLKELARLHAASLLLQVKDGFQDLEAKYTFLDKDCFDVSEDTIKLTKGILDDHIEKTITLLKEFDEYRNAVHWLEHIKPQAFEKMEKKLNRHTRFDVVCHGDCWSNNVLFKYDEEGNPIDVVLRNLQLVRRSSLAVDLNCFFYNNLAGPDRKANLELYLDIYYVSFKSVLDAACLAMPFMQHDLYQQYKSKNLYGILWAMIFIPMMISEKDDSPDKSTAQDQEDSETVEKTTDPQVDSEAFTEKSKDLQEVSKAFAGKTEGQENSKAFEEKTQDLPENTEAFVKKTEDPQENSETFAEKRQNSMLFMFRNNAEMMARFLSLFDDVVDGKKEDQ